MLLKQSKNVNMKAKMLTLLGFIGMTVALASCGGHTHKGEDAWQHSDDEHYHVCPDCNQKYGYAEHTLTKTTVTEAKCETAGKDKYTCSVCGYSYEEDVAALGHDFTNAVRHYQWDAGHTKCDASVACTRAGCNHVVSESCTTCTYEIIKDPTCEDYGEVRATATFTNPLFETQSESFQSGEPTEHDYSYTSPFWVPKAGGSFDVYVLAQCIHPGCSKSMKIDAVSVVSAHKSDSTCTVHGEDEYTATFPQGSEIPEAKKIVKLPLANHVSDEILHHDASGHWNECRVCSARMNEADHTFVNGVCVCGEEREYTSIETLVKMNTVPEDTKYTTIGKITGIYNYSDNCEVWLGDGEYSIEVASVKKADGLTLEVGKYLEVVDATYVRDTSKKTITLKNADYVGNIDFTATSHPTEITVTDPVDFPITLASWPTVIETIENNTTLNRCATVVGTVKQVPTSFDKTKDNTFVVVDNTGATVTVFAKKNALTDTVYTALSALHVGDKVTISGVISHYNGNTQLVALSAVECTQQALVVISAANGDKTIMYRNDPNIQNAISYAASLAPTDDSVTTIDVYADNSHCDGATLVDGQNIVLNLHGHTLKFDHNSAGSSGTKSQCFQVLKGASLSISDGKLEISTDIINDAHFRVGIQNYGNVVLNNVTIDLTNATGDKTGSYVVSNNCGTFTMDKSSKLIAAEGGVAFDLWYGMNASYEEGINVILPADLPEANVTGRVEYGHASLDLNPDTWFNKAIVTVAGETTFMGTVKDADQIAPGSVKNYATFAEFKADLVEVKAVLVSIEVDPTDAQTEFKVGEKFTSAGIKVVANYDIGAPVDVTALVTVDLAEEYTFVHADYPSKEVTVSFNGKSDTYDVNVLNNAIAVKDLAALSDKTPAVIEGNIVARNARNFILADGNNLNDLTYVYNNTELAQKYAVGTFVRVTRGAKASNYGLPEIMKAGDQNLYFAETPLNENPEIVPSYSLITSSNWDDDEFMGTNIRGIKGYVQVNADGNLQAMTDPYDPTTLSTKTGYFNSAVAPNNIGNKANAGKIYYFEGYAQGLNSSGNRVIMVNTVNQVGCSSISLKVDGGASASIKTGETAQLAATISPSGAKQDFTYVKGGDNPECIDIDEDGVVSVVSTGTCTVVAKQGDVTSNTVTINATQLTVESLSISGTATKTTYSVGDDWDPSGLTVTANMSDGSTPDVTDQVTWSFDPATAANTSITSVKMIATFDGVSNSKDVSVTVKDASTITLTMTFYNEAKIDSTSGSDVTLAYFKSAMSGLDSSYLASMTKNGTCQYNKNGGLTGGGSSAVGGFTLTFEENVKIVSATIVGTLYDNGASFKINDTAGTGSLDPKKTKLTDCENSLSFSDINSNVIEVMTTSKRATIYILTLICTVAD